MPSRHRGNALNALEKAGNLIIDIDFIKVERIRHAPTEPRFRRCAARQLEP